MAAESDGQGGREKATIDTSPTVLKNKKLNFKINGKNYKYLTKNILKI